MCCERGFIHTHPFNGPLSRTTRVSRYQKGKTNLDFTEARDSEWQWHQLGHMQVCTALQTDSTPAPHHSVFYRPDALPAAQPTVSKHWRQWLCISMWCNSVPPCWAVIQGSQRKNEEKSYKTPNGDHSQILTDFGDTYSQLVSRICSRSLP